jgi:hypothetical protein
MSLWKKSCLVSEFYRNPVNNTGYFFGLFEAPDGYSYNEANRKYLYHPIGVSHSRNQKTKQMRETVFGDVYQNIVDGHAYEKNHGKQDGHEIIRIRQKNIFGILKIHTSHYSLFQTKMIIHNY